MTVGSSLHDGSFGVSFVLPFGDTPALDVNNLSHRLGRRRLLCWGAIVLSVAFSLLGTLMWLGDRFAPLDPATGTVISRSEYHDDRGTTCFLGVSYVYRGEVHTSASPVVSSCAATVSVGPTIGLLVSRTNPQEIFRLDQMSGKESITVLVEIILVLPTLMTWMVGYLKLRSIKGIASIASGHPWRQIRCRETRFGRGPGGRRTLTLSVPNESGNCTIFVLSDLGRSSIGSAPKVSRNENSLWFAGDTAAADGRLLIAWPVGTYVSQARLDQLHSGPVPGPLLADVPMDSDH